jgi:hypothetical protein
MGGPGGRLLGLVLLAELLSGCVTGFASPALDAEAKLFQAHADTACIYVVPSNSSASVTILLDSRTVATLDNPTYLRLNAPPGQHVFAVTRATLLPTFLGETPNALMVEVEAGQCYFFRTVWRQDEQSWQTYQVYLVRVTAAEGEREINIRQLVLPRK